jgi:hypothetical protein
LGLSESIQEHYQREMDGEEKKVNNRDVRKVNGVDFEYPN